MIPTHEWRQFRVLYRGFLLRFLDIELLSTHGDITGLLSQIGALLAAASFALMVFKVPQYFFATKRLTYSEILVAGWGDQEFMISTTMAVVGIFTVLMWDSLFADRRDCLVLAQLPVRMRTMFAAKVTAMGAALGLTLGSVNAFSGLVYPFLVVPDGAGRLALVRGFAAFWLTMVAASLFLFCALLALQGLAMHLLPHARFLRASSYLQLFAFFSIVSVYFLTPPLATQRGLTAPDAQYLLKLIPSFWFLGLYQELNGPIHPVFGWLAERALWATLIAVVFGATTYVFAYGRHVRRVIEQAGIVPADRTRPASRLARFAAARMSSKPLEQAIFLFIARTLARSRQHRMLLAIYGGIGLAYALTYLREMLYHRGGTPWGRPSVSLLSASLVLLFFTLVGLRVCFTLPVELRANWVFQITESKGPAAYRAAIRKSLLFMAPLPLLLLSSIAYFGLWPWRPALAHLLVLTLTTILIIEVLLSGFRKIPFTCSYLPGKANLKVMLGVYAFGFMFIADLLVRTELWAMDEPGRFVSLLAILVAAIVLTKWHAARTVIPLDNKLLFEELPNSEILALDLRI